MSTSREKPHGGLSRTTNSTMSITLTYCIVQALLLLLRTLIYLRHRKEKQNSKSESSPQEQRPRQPSGKISHSYRTDPKNRELQADLLTLLRNDVPAAKRLLIQQRQSNPGKSDNWYL
ncbi:hypothetical protein [Nostoc sp.]|uniref:hypothetical protein n=1 Tax=Nostoc sp. TaxID=1180 RepID=UPI002FF59526